MVTIAPTCSANAVELKIVYSESDDYNIRVRIDYVCNWNENEMVSGNKSALHSHTHCSYLQVCMSICGNLGVVEVKQLQLVIVMFSFHSKLDLIALCSHKGESLHSTVVLRL